MTSTINRPVFFGASAIIALLVMIGIVFPRDADRIFGAAQAWVLDTFGWFYLLAVGVFVFFALFLAISRYGTLKLGPDDAEPDYSYLSWLAMLFAAGMGIGLMFYAVAEPILHYSVPPEAEAGSYAAARQAMAITYFHWGIHAWSIYAVVGLSLAYFCFRYNLPLTIRSGFYPLIKDRISGPIGHAVDIFAICGTLFGIATSLGLGVLQINAGLNYLLDVPQTALVQVALIAVVTLAATLSVVSGLDVGIRRLSEGNLILAILLMLFVLVVGPTEFLFRAFVQNVGTYLDSILERTFTLYAYEPKSWISDWTLFYWAWWISWSPFVGMFIARISRGRTVREFVVGVLFVPSAFTFFWMTTFGNTAISLDMGVASGAISQAVGNDISVALFQFFQYLPWPTFTSVLGIVLVAVFFVTSSDSGSMVVDTIASGGNEDTPVWQRIYWCSMEGIVAALLLLAGGLTALQTMTLISALPFTIILLLLAYGLLKGMKADMARAEKQAQSQPAVPMRTIGWQERLQSILYQPSRKDVEAFIGRTVEPALTDVRDALKRRNVEAVVERDDSAGSVQLTVHSSTTRNFVYGVQPVAQLALAFSAAEVTRPDARRSHVWSARTVFADGSRGYDVMGFTRDDMLADVLAQFERYQVLTSEPSTQLYATSPDPA
ncbi:BCCT family transporter [Aureimonas frigidaquae]|uniref:Choline/carnitine/betaine transporter n=1 Tax=Aureimonas frigidaquae TaxID=424757 RepID=A0A0N7KY51_9HYPH|nr:BCCT family transporter [Aureimonas frigidaquae]BAT28745.1 choline/carnitine/betaine transporter [Aureimonas frigidaquae]